MTNNHFPKSIFLPLIVGAAAALSACASASPGRVAVEQGNSARLQQILDQPNHSGEDINKLLDDSIFDFNCVECARVLFQAGAKGVWRWYAGRGVVHDGLADRLAHAAEGEHAQMTRLLIDYGAEPTALLLEWRQAIQGSRGSGSEAQYEQQQAALQNLTEFFKKVELDRAARPAAPAPAASVPVVAAAEPLRARAAPLFHEAERPDDYALIVGIEKYDDLPAATYAERDAAAAADFVQAMGVPTRNIATLTGERATRSGLAKKLEGWLANNVNENSTVYFYYSGHGAPDTKTGEAYLVPFDGDPEYLDQTAYPLKHLYEKLNALKAKRVIVMLDSCFSGAGGRSVLAKGARPLVSNVDTGFIAADGKLTVLAAAGAEQISGTTDEKGHGLFSYYLFNGLNGGAKDASGQVTVKSLFDYLKPKVMDDAHRANRDQVPQFQSGGTAAADVVLRAK